MTRALAGGLAVRVAVLEDIAYIDALRRRESEQIGFLSRVVYEGAITRRGPWWRDGRVWLAEVNDQPVGFLYATPGALGRAARIIQVCLQPDARRIEYGRALVEQAEAWAFVLQRPAVGCHVATDIEARAFWDAVGYPTTGLLPGGARRGRVLESRYKLLDGGLWVAA